MNGMPKKYPSGTPKVCPKCGDELVRPVAVYVICGETTYQITSDGVKEQQYKNRCSCGVRIVREFLCENGDCRWREIDEFSHGSTFEASGLVSPWYGPDKVIWRD